MAEFPALPIWTDAFIADTLHLTAEETGAYFMLLLCAWRSPDCALPNDDTDLCRFARSTPRRWTKIRDRVMRFWTLEDGHWKQKRLSKVRVDVTRNVDQKRHAGKLGGEAKALKYKEASVAAATKPPKRLSANQNQNQNQIEKDKPKKVYPKRGVRLPDDFSPKDKDIATLKAKREVTDQQIADENEKFRDYWIAQPGQKGVKLDWHATWRNWMRNASFRVDTKAPVRPNGKGVMIRKPSRQWCAWEEHARRNRDEVLLHSMKKARDGDERSFQCEWPSQRK